MHEHTHSHEHENTHLEANTEATIEIANAGTPLMIIGTDADARMALDIANAQEVVVYGFMSDKDEDLQKEINNVSVLMRIDSPEGKKFLDSEKVDIIVVDREISRRKNLARKALSRKSHIVNLIYPDIVISPYSSIGRGNLIGSSVVILANTHIGSHNSIQAGVFIDCDTIVQDYCTIQSGAKIGRNVKIEDEVFIGMGAIINTGVTIKKGALIAPGAVVIQSVNEGVSMVGNPAKSMK